MASIINASNTSGLVFTSDMSGVLQLQQNGVALPALSVAPAFSAYMTASQTIPNTTATKIAFNAKSYDTNTNYDISTYRFTPTVAGYYQCSARISTPGSSTGITYLYIAKNGNTDTGLNSAIGNNSSGLTISTSGLLYCNGSTDYIEAYTYQSTGGSASMGSSTIGYANFQGFLARGA